MSDSSPQIKNEPNQEDHDNSDIDNSENNDVDVSQEENDSPKIKKESLSDNDYEEDQNDSDDFKVKKEEQYSSDDEDYSYEETKKKKKKKMLNKKRSRDKKKKNRKKESAKSYLDFEAEESEEEDSADGEITAEQQKKLMAQYENKGLYERKPMANLTEEQILDKIKGMNENEYIDINDGVGKQALQPNISDPKLWLIKCRIGKERECVQNLYHKYFFYNKPGNIKIKILSAMSFDSLKGYIYIEAYKEANVREAIMGMSNLRENSIRIVPIGEMIQVFSFDKISKIDLKPKQWVRMKSGLYEGDLAQVVSIEDPINKIYVRIIPRLQDQEEGKNENIGEYNKKLKKNIKPRQKLFNPKHYNNIESKSHALIGTYITWNKQMFKDGFLIKAVKSKSLITENVVPKIEELKIFDMAKFNRDDDEEPNERNNDLDYLSTAIQEAEISKRKKFEKGDRVKIIKGELNGITGKVIQHLEKIVQLYPNVEEMSNEVLEIPEDYLIKEFLPGEMVQVISGPNIGKQGYVVKTEDDVAVIFSESTKSYYKASVLDLISSTQVFYQPETNSFFKIGELVKINNTNSICYVLNVSQYSLKLIDTRNEIKTVSVRDVFKLSSHKINGIDGKKNPITKDDTVKVISGPYKGTKAVIKNIYKYYVFLHNNDYIQSNGIFAENSDNIEILGSELLIDADGSRGRVNRKMIPEEIRAYIGKTVKIIMGVWKGYSGIVKDVTDKMAYVELSSKPKTIRLELSAIIRTDIQTDDSNGFGGFRGDTMTPRAMAQPKTPAYYPQSPGYNNAISTPNYFSAMSPKTGW